MPFIDTYGQYKHGEWAEKIHSDEDLKKNHEKELAELEKSSAPWNGTVSADGRTDPS